MKSSQRSRRMARNHRRLAQPAKLNLVALMDIFTILVLFLIVNNGDVEVLQADRRVSLPESVSELRPEAAAVITLTGTDILINDRHVSAVEEALAAMTDTLPVLQQALADAAAQSPTSLTQDHALGRPVVIMGDRDTPYALLKRIMATCAASDYRDVSLAVNHAPATAPPAATSAGLAMRGAAP